ncbi:thiaminase II [Bacillus sp. 1P06AnD]|uniref:thiaminase II n=1 Tax=Bacillus sp. 1P06AnD TaxID=3132208 RepID=UPI0039A0CA15
MVTDELYDVSKEIWQAYLVHPFVEEMRTGKLDRGKFEHYLIQDYLYLKEYAKVFAQCMVKSSTLEEMRFFHNGISNLLNVESGVHIEYLRSMGHIIEDLEKERADEVTEAYTNHMKGIALTGDLKQLAVAMLPCVWSYYEIGMHMVKNQEDAEGTIYKEWIAAYSDNGYAGICRDWLEYTNRLIANCTEEEAEKLSAIFRTSSLYELRFWDNAYMNEAVKFE